MGVEAGGSFASESGADSRETDREWVDLTVSQSGQVGWVEEMKDVSEAWADDVCRWSTQKAYD